MKLLATPMSLLVAMEALEKLPPAPHKVLRGFQQRRPEVVIAVEALEYHNSLAPAKSSRLAPAATLQQPDALRQCSSVDQY
jgi:hypothetical protein